jgi:lipopolysaccharide export system protein LptA
LARLVRRIFLVAALAVVAAYLSAQRPGTANYLDAQGLVGIDAQSLSVDDIQQTATFAGNVVVSKGELHAECSRLVLHYHANVIDSMACEPGHLFHLID